MNIKCEYCNKKTEKIYENERSRFYICKHVHNVKDVNKANDKELTKQVINPVFMVRKKVKA